MILVRGQKSSRRLRGIASAAMERSHRAPRRYRGKRKTINELDFWRAGHGETLFL